MPFVSFFHTAAALVDNERIGFVVAFSPARLHDHGIPFQISIANVGVGIERSTILGS